MDLNLLRTFMAVYSTQNISHAADDLRQSQPATSQHVKSLESHMGRRLFVREHRGVTPTPAADALAAELAAPLAALEHASTRGCVSTDVSRASLIIAGPPDLIASKALPQLAPLVQAGLRVTAVMEVSRNLTEKVASGEIDLGFQGTPSSRPGIAVRPYFTEELVVIEAATAPERRGSNDFTADPLIAYSTTVPLVRRYWRAEFPGHTTPEPAVTVPDLRAVVAAVRAGLGWSVVPSYLAVNALETGDLAEAHAPSERPSNQLYVTTALSRSNMPAIVAALEILSPFARP